MMSASEASFLSLFLFSFEIHASRVSHVYVAGISRAYFSSVSFVLHTHNIQMRGNAQSSRGGGMGQIGVGVSKRGFGGGSDKSIIVFGIPRMYTAIILYAASVFFVVKTSAIVSLVVAYVVGLGLVGLHASMRSPNLKARLENAQQEFRAAWRGQTPDYTL